MADLEQLARHQGPRGEVVLRRRTSVLGPVEELIVNGAFAMDSAETETERRLGRLALQGGRRRILVGGLGLGYTVSEVLGGDVDRVDVVEIEQALVDWARSGLTPTLAAVAADPRVRLHVGDVRTVLTATDQRYGPWDAIVLDVDNGPDFLIHADNDALYAEPTLRSAYRQLSPGGSLAIWCQGVAPDLLATLGRIAPNAREHRYQVSRGERQFTYAIYELVRLPDRPAMGPRSE